VRKSNGLVLQTGFPVEVRVTVLIEMIMLSDHPIRISIGLSESNVCGLIVGNKFPAVFSFLFKNRVSLPIVLLEFIKLKANYFTPPAKKETIALGSRRLGL